jgi:hypothetical protein
MAFNNDFFIGCDVSPCVFELVCRLRGMENGMMDLAIESEASQSLLARAGSFSAKLAAHTVPPETPLENVFAMYEMAGISREEIFDRAAEIRLRSSR